MFHPLTPDLVDPMLLAEISLPSLHQAVSLQSGSVTLTVDPSIRNPIRVKPEGSAVYGPNAKRDVEDLVLTLNEAFAPFTVEFLKAKVRIDDAVWPIDLMTCVSSLQLMYMRAQHCNDLIGHTVMLELSASLPPDGNIQPSVICALQGSDGRDRKKSGALAEYMAAVEALWGRLVQNSLGHWLRDNRVREFRLAGEFLIDPRQAMAAIGQPLPEAAAPAA